MPRGNSRLVQWPQTPDYSECGCRWEKLFNWKSVKLLLYWCRDWATTIGASWGLQKDEGLNLHRLHIEPRSSPLSEAQSSDSGNPRGEGTKPEGSVDSCVWWGPTGWELQDGSQKQAGYEHNRDAVAVQGFGCLVVKGVFCGSASWDTAVTQILSPDLTHLTLVDLRPAKTYSLRMFATNGVGTSHSSNVLTITTKEAGRVESRRNGLI